MKIEIFSDPQCNYCNQAKALLDEIVIDYIELDISDDKHRNELAYRLPRVHSIPQIFVNDEYIGGFEDLQIFKDKCQLEEIPKGVRLSST